MNIRWVLKSFNDLTPDELYAVMRLRIEVFVVEQNCVFQDLDNKDQNCLHFMGWNDEMLYAYTRIVPPGVAYDLPAIGRVVTSSKARGGTKPGTISRAPFARTATVSTRRPSTRRHAGSTGAPRSRPSCSPGTAVTSSASMTATRTCA